MSVTLSRIAGQYLTLIFHQHTEAKDVITSKMFIFPPHYYANCVSTMLTVLILHNVQSVYFFHTNPVHKADGKCLASGLSDAVTRQLISFKRIAIPPHCVQIAGGKLFAPRNPVGTRPHVKCDGAGAENRFRLSAKRTSPFKSAGGVSSVDCWQPRCAH
jgi:hypothetical protein